MQETYQEGKASQPLDALTQITSKCPSNVEQVHAIVNIGYGLR